MMIPNFSAGSMRADAAILPPPGPAVQRRMLAVVHAMGGLIQQSSSADPKFHGCVVLPFAKVVLAGTACARPLLFAECEALAREAGYDAVVLRHDAIRGTTFDIKLTSEPRWFRRYLAAPDANGVLMQPDIGIGPVFRASALGLRVIDDHVEAKLQSRTGQRAAPSSLVEA